MKAPLLNETERWFYTKNLSCLHNDMLELRMAVAKFKQVLGKSRLIQKVIKPLVDHLSKL